MSQELALTESRTLRAQHTESTYVLDKVKALAVLPDGLHVTTDMVATYYEVPTDTIKSVVEDNTAELATNGRLVLRGAELREFARPFGGPANLGLHHNTRSLAVFDRRAVLNVGMLLRDSRIARRVRQYLLDAEEDTPEANLPSLGDPLDELEQTNQRLSQAIGIARRERADRQAAEQRAAELEPDAEYTRRTVDADGLRLVGQVAKSWGLREKDLRAYLYAEGLLIEDGHRRNDPTAYAIQRGWLKPKSRTYGDPPRKVWTTYFTARGEVGVWRRRYSQGLEQRPLPPQGQLAIEGLV